MIPYINIHTHNHIDNKEIVEIINIDVDNIVNVDVSLFYSIGVHPWDIESNSQQTLSEMSLRMSDSNILAIGECGLDRVHGSDFEQQKQVFMKQIEMSEHYAKPLMVHSVKSYSDIVSIRKEIKASMPWIIHGFQGNEQTATQLLRHDGIYLSLGEVLFRNEVKAQRLLHLIPSDRLFLETDIADRSIVDVYEKASSLSGMEKLRNDIFNNFVKIFGQI